MVIVAAILLHSSLLKTVVVDHRQVWTEAHQLIQIQIAQLTIVHHLIANPQIIAEIHHLEALEVVAHQAVEAVALSVEEAVVAEDKFINQKG